jgi:hypothetical protein
MNNEARLMQPTTREIAHVLLVRVRRASLATLERVMHSGALLYRTHKVMVMPAEAGIQVVPGLWIPACTGMTFPLYFRVLIAAFKMHNTL